MPEKKKETQQEYIARKQKETGDTSLGSRGKFAKEWTASQKSKAGAQAKAMAPKATPAKAPLYTNIGTKSRIKEFPTLAEWQKAHPGMSAQAYSAAKAKWQRENQ